MSEQKKEKGATAPAVANPGKSEVVRHILSGPEYINFSTLTARLDFGEKMPSRREKEAVVGLGLNILSRLVQKVLDRSPGYFVKADAEHIISEGSKPETDYQERYLKLVRALEKAAKGYDIHTEVMPSKLWDGVVSALPPGTLQVNNDADGGSDN